CSEPGPAHCFPSVAEAEEEQEERSGEIRSEPNATRRDGAGRPGRNRRPRPLLTCRLTLDRQAGLAYPGAVDVAEGGAVTGDGPLGCTESEAEWLACVYPDPMLEFLRGKPSGRKLRLLAVACCRRVWDKFISQSSRRAVEVCERFADGLATRKELRNAEFAA